MSRRAFRTWLFAATSGIALAAGAAQAQTISQPTPPEHYTLDPRGVDLVTGHFNFQTTEVMIGQPGQGGLALTRGRIQLQWRDSNQGSLTVSGSTYTVVSGLGAEVFTLSGGVFTPKSNNGSTLTQSGATFTFTTSSGTVLRYTTAYCFTSTGVACTTRAALYEIVTPNGETTNYHYVTQSYVRSVDPNGNPVMGTVARLQSITNNRGYRLQYVYKSNTMSGSGSLNTKVGNWLAVASITGANNAVDYCAPTAFSCTYSRTWPSIAYTSTVGGPITAATDQSGRVTQYIYGATSADLTGIRYPGSTTNDVTIAENTVTAQVSSLTDATGAWNYSFADSGVTRTAVSTGPNGQSTTVVTDLTVGRPSTITNALGQTVGFLYDAQGRLTRTTNPEGDYVEQTFDARGNVTQVTATPKSGSGLSPITSSSTFDASCANPVICNLPLTTTDAAGNVTDYTWDSTHGGPLTITAPAPSSGADRPQTRYTYAAQTAYYKNSSGVIAAAPSSVTLPTQVSACATGTSCIGGANEVRTTVGYGATGVANNLHPSGISKGSGANPTMSTTYLTWTSDGDLEYVDGPLSGSGDTTRYRYDNARQRVGMVGPDPDGGGAGSHRAQRLTYNPRGQVTLAETGATAGYGDTDWANFNPLVRSATVYDALGRPLVSSQQSGAGTTVGVQQVSYDASGRPECSATRMNPATWGSLPTSACTATAAGTDGPDRITHATYDAAGRPLSTTTAYGVSGVAATTSVTYTANGQTGSMTDGKGNVSTMVYDGFNRLSELQYPGHTPSAPDMEAYLYDAASNVTRFTNRSGAYIYTNYDALNRPTASGPPAAQGQIRTYDNLGRLASIYTTDGISWSASYAWDALSRLTSETGPLGVMSYQYDAAGRRTRITWPDAFYAQYDRDVSGAVTAIRENGATSGAGVLASYAYNNLGQPTGITRGDGTATAFGYDAAGRMSGLSHDMAGSGADVVFGYAWNPAGQIASRTVSNAAYVLAPTTGSATYVNNALNQVATINSVGVTYDENQNLTGALGNSYVYDAKNQLTSATIGGTAHAFGYDPGGRLYSSPGGYFQYVGAQLAGEYNGSGVLTTRHIPGPGLDQPVATLFGGARVQQIADERGSVIGVADSSGAVNINRYDEYGVPSAANRFQYTGQAWMAPGLYNYRARAYAPELGRFLQPDPIGYAAGPNVYGYVGGDPVNLTDPFGLLPPCRDGDEVHTCEVTNYSERCQMNWICSDEGIYLFLSELNPIDRLSMAIGLNVGGAGVETPSSPLQPVCPSRSESHPLIGWVGLMGDGAAVGGTLAGNPVIAGVGSTVSFGADVYEATEAVMNGDAIGVASSASGFAASAVPGARVVGKIWDAGRNGLGRFVPNWGNRRAAQATAVKAAQQRAASGLVDGTCS